MPSSTTASRKTKAKKSDRVPIETGPSSDDQLTLTDFNFHDIEKLFSDLFNRRQLGFSKWPNLVDFQELREKAKSRLPDIDVIDRRKELLVKVELPGCAKDDVSVRINHDSLTITATAHQEKSAKTDSYLRREISSREYSRTIPLPTGVNPEQAEAKMNKGVLRLNIPKQGGRKTRNVKIN